MMRKGIGPMRHWGRALSIALIFLLTREAYAQSLKKIFQEEGIVWSLAPLEDGRILYTLRSGELKVYQPKDKSRVLIKGTPEVYAKGQGGLFDVVLAPDFKRSGMIYLSYAKDLGGRQTTALGRGQWQGGSLKNFEELFVAQPGTTEGQHFAGKIVIKDGKSLFLTVGDRGKREMAQDLGSHMGSVLRLTLDGKPHPDNPFLKTKGALAEIFSYGHRNPQGAALHPITGELWIHEHGPRGGDEINLVEAGKNYGWPVITYGKEYWGPRIGQGTHKEGMEQPLHYYVPSIASSGLAIYAGKRYPKWQHRLIIGALAGQHVNVVTMEGRKFIKEERFFAQLGLRFRDVRLGPDDYLYVSTDEGGVYRIDP